MPHEGKQIADIFDCKCRYLPNAPSGGSYSTNVSTYTLEYSREDTQLFLNSMYDITTRGMTNSTSSRDEQWPACLACALVDRRRAAANISRTDICNQCMTRYCWDTADLSGVAGSASKNPDQVYTDSASTLSSQSTAVKMSAGLALAASIAMWAL